MSPPRCWVSYELKNPLLNFIILACSQNTFNCLFAVTKYNRRFKNLAITFHYYAFFPNHLFSQTSPRSVARSSLHCSALARLCLAHVAQLVSLGFTWLRLAWVTRLYSAQLCSARVARLARIASLRSALHPGSLLASLAPVTQLA